MLKHVTTTNRQGVKKLRMVSSTDNKVDEHNMASDFWTRRDCLSYGGKGPQIRSVKSDMFIVTHRKSRLSQKWIYCLLSRREDLWCKRP